MSICVQGAWIWGSSDPMKSARTVGVGVYFTYKPQAASGLRCEHLRMKVPANPRRAAVFSALSRACSRACSRETLPDGRRRVMGSRRGRSSCTCRPPPRSHSKSHSNGCLALAFHCLSLTFHCLSLTVHCLSLTFHCLSLTFHCLSLTFRRFPGTTSWSTVRGGCSAAAARSRQRPSSCRCAHSRQVRCRSSL